MAEVRKAAKKKPNGKIVPKKPKPAKKSAKIVKVTAIERVSKIDMQPIGPDAPASGLSQSFIREAQKLDVKIVSTIERMGKDVIALGESFSEMSSKGYHVALGFAVFTDYIKARWPDQNKTTVFQAMTIVRQLTDGPHPVASKADIREMTVTNAEGLARLKKSGVTITPQMIQEAKVLPIARFQEEVVLANQPMIATRKASAVDTDQDGLTATAHVSSPEIMVRRSFLISSTTEAARLRCFEVCRYLNKEDLEDTLPREADTSFEDKAYAAIFAEFLATYEAEFEGIKEQEKAREFERARASSDKLGDIPEDMTPEDADEAAMGAPPETSEDGEEASQTIEAVLPQAVYVPADGEVREVEAGKIASTCAFIGDNLKRCQSIALRGENFCFFHKEKGEAALREVAVQ